MFAVTEAPLPLSIRAFIVSSTIQLDWPVSGDPFVLESKGGLDPGNWQTVTNSPRTVSDRVVVQITGDSGSRFFRLRRLSP